MSDSDELPDALGEELFQALHPIHLQFGKRPFEELKARLIAVGDTLALRFETLGYARAALETRRRVTHDILTLSLDARRPVEECTGYLHQVIALGFENLRARAQIVTMFGGNMSRRPGNEALVRHLLIPLRDDLRAALEIEDNIAHRSFLADCEMALARVQS